MFKRFILDFLIALLNTVLVQAHTKIISTSKPSDFVVQETKKWMGTATPFKNSSSDEEMSKSIADLLSWKTPDYFVKHFPYYLSGLSYEKIPIYIFESGKYDMVAVMRQGPEVMNNFEDVFVQGVVEYVAGNYAVDTLYKTFRPISGQLSERIEIYGPKKSKWLAVLKREFPPRVSSLVVRRLGKFHGYCYIRMNIPFRSLSTGQTGGTAT